MTASSAMAMQTNATPSGPSSGSAAVSTADRSQSFARAGRLTRSITASQSSDTLADDLATVLGPAVLDDPINEAARKRLVPRS